MVIATKNHKDRQGFQSITDIDINSIKFSSIKGAPSEQSQAIEKDFLLE
jgi:hypothetical protein